MKNSLKTLTNIIIELIKKYRGDWKENNPSSPNYIKNKPFYSIKEIKTLVNVKKTDLYEGEPWFQFKYFDIIENNVYTIIFNGETYECKPRIWYYDGGLEYIMGNSALDDYGADTGEPFLIWGTKESDYSDASIYFPSDEPIAEVELQIIGEVETIQKIDDKFLPQGIGKKGSGKNSEIFNDYSSNFASGNYSHTEGYSNDSWGNYAHTEGRGNACGGNYAHVEGYGGSCYGECSHVEGMYCYTGYDYCHAEGYDTSASGQTSHAEGYGTTTSGNYSHAEGYRSNARGGSSHSEGSDTNAFGDCSHAEGHSTNNTNSVNITRSSTIPDIYNKWSSYKFSLAKGLCSHVEGSNCMALSTSSHAEGECTVAGADCSHTEGYRTHTLGNYAHAEGFSHTISNFLGYSISDFITKWDTSKFALAYGRASHVEGDSCLAMKDCSHGEGHYTQATGDYSHSEGSNTVAEGTGSHSEGCQSKAKGMYSHAEGYDTRANGNYSHAEGNSTYADGSYSHAEGDYCYASGTCSHAEGSHCRAEGGHSHAEGEGCNAYGQHSHVEGNNTVAGSKCQHVQGKNNVRDDNNKYAHIVGNGSGVADELRSNAHTLDWNGNGWYQGNLYVGGTNQDDGNKVLSTADINFDSDGNLTITINGVTKKFAPIG